MFYSRFMFFLLVGLTFGLGASVCPAQNQPAGGAAAQAVAARPTPQVQSIAGAIWVSASDGRYREPIKVTAFVDDLKSLPFDEIIVQVRAAGDAYYNSTLVPKALGVPEAFDPLAELVKNFHAQPRPKKVIAWITPYMVGNQNTPIPISALHVTATHPDWLASRADGTKSDTEGHIYLEAGLPAVQQHLERVVSELLRNYEIDGLYLDPMIDSGGDGQWGYHPSILAHWQQQTGSTAKPAPDDPQWIAFRVKQMTDALAGLARAAQAVKPGLLVAVGGETDGTAPGETDFSASAVYRQQHQDWPGWINNKLVGRIYLKNFKNEGTLAQSFDAWMKLAVSAASRAGVPVYIGVGGQHNESVMALAQMRRAADSGAEGIALFDYTTPIMDKSSSTLFFNAINRVVFGPGAARRSITHATPVKLKPVVTAAGPTTTAPATTSPAATAPTAALSIPSQPTPVPATASAPTTATANLQLPPPPSVPDESDGELIPIYSEPGTPVPLGQEPPERGPAMAEQKPAEPGLSVADLKALAGTATAEGATTATTPIANGAALTQREMLSELLRDPQFTEMHTATFLAPNETAREYLRQTFRNIFD